METDQLVHVVDDDDAIRDSVQFQLETAGFAVRTYPSAEAFLRAMASASPGCVLTDLRMPGMSGMELVHALTERGFDQPIIMMTGHGDIAVAVEAMKAGVSDFIEKPVEDDNLLRVIREVLTARSADENAERASEVKARFAALSPREHDVLLGVVAGKPNKVIAFDLGISPRTVEVYRAGLMTKSGASSLSELVRMALIAGL